ncbi:hypothetical protein BU17DRAFT_55907 [Hysterangium stoloniferum]|nr:hypothetical protein BU17DRAFT_55907 [Hysterangium stoloniferum]
MTHNIAKPLPDVPDTSMKRLTIDSNDLLSSLIERHVEEERLEHIWTDVIARALTNFGAYLHSENIIPQLQTTRKNQIQLKVAAETAKREQRRKERERWKESKGSKSRASEKSKEIELANTDYTKVPVLVDVKLKQIAGLMSKTPADSMVHLFLTVAPFSEHAEHDSEYDVVQATGSCIFVSGRYNLPYYEESGMNYGDGGIVLCGLDNWNLDEFKESPWIAGGTFTFQGVMSAAAHEALVSSLRLSIYAYLSLILEQCVMADFQVRLHYPPKPQIIAFPFEPLPVPAPVMRRSRSVKSASSIWSFISKKTEGIIQRVSDSISDNMNSPLIRTGSLSSPLRAARRTPRVSEEISHPNTDIEPVEGIIEPSRAESVEEEERQDRERFGSFSSAVRRVQDRRCILSTSPRIVFPPPRIIVLFAQREEELKLSGHVEANSESSLASSTASVTLSPPNSLGGTPTLRLTGIDKTALSSVLGWESREARGKGMTGVKGFVRHQGLTVLYVEHVVIGEEKRTCGRPKWITYRYWSRYSSVDATADRPIGEFVEYACDKTVIQEHCELEGCEKLRGEHSINWTCSGVNVMCTSKESAGSGSDDGIDVWQSCGVCGKSTEPEPMSDGTYLYSFAKFLELLIWSPIMCTTSLCEHTASSLPVSQPGNLLSSSRYNILRHFRRNGRTMTFTVESVEKCVYELRFPELQIISSSAPRDEKYLSDVRKKREDGEERIKIATEIEGWWNGIKEHIDKLEEFLEKEAEESLHCKDLPPLPASDDEDFDEELLPSRPPTPPARPTAFRSISASSQKALGALTGQSMWPAFMVQKLNAPYPLNSGIPIRESRMLLARLRVSFQTTEDALRRQLSNTPTSSLNDVRRAFRSTARGAQKRLAAWQVKHAPEAPATLHACDAICAEPEWWSGNCHAVPGGRVVVREGESGSIIAFTLSAVDYQRELANLSTVSGNSPSPGVSTISSESHFSDTVATIKSGKPPAALLDPDASDMAVWEEKEPCTAVISRKEHPREGSTLLGLRDVLRTKRSFDGSSSSSRFSGSISRGISNVIPPSAWAQPQVQVNLEPVDGLVSQFPQAAEVVEKVLESHYPLSSRSSSPLPYDGEITPTPSSFVEHHIRRGGDLSIISSDGETEGVVYNEVSVPLVAPQPTRITSTVLVPSAPSGVATPPANNLTGALSNAMRYLLSPATPPSRVPSPAPPGLHGLLAYEPATAIDEHPHIKYEWTIGQRLKFSCTVYYAKQFDTLRRRCGVDTDVIKSLERSENWTAVGGKSRSNFWKSADGRFIIKTLVNAWNVADLHVLIELAPSYFRYLDSTASKASAIAKLMGFYTVEVKNLETGVVQAKHDLLVMENLFYKHKIAKTYDLKGIQSRKVKQSQDSVERQRTLFDGEWLEAQQRAPILIQPYSGYILHEAVRNDADFLAKSNIMDYSLLLGIDEERHEIACGLVDTIGSYTFAKTLEHKVKHNLHSGKGKEVTVIPPTEYHNRFITSMDQYFLTCPGKELLSLSFLV